MSNKKENSIDAEFALQTENYKLLIIGVAIIFIGFVLMIGGKSDDPNVFNEEMFNFRRVTLAPIVVLFGFLFEIFAIMYRPKKTANSEVSSTTTK